MKNDHLARLLASANSVPGFDPTEYAVPTEDGGMYLKVFYRKAWFRLKYPTGKIVTTPIALKEQMCVFKAEVFLDRNDDQPVAMAYASRCYVEGNPYSIYYVENAETAAIGRALANAGFNVGFTPGEDDEEGLADAPTGGNETVKNEVSESEKAPAKGKRGRKKKEEPKPEPETQPQEEPAYASVIEPDEGTEVKLPESAQVVQSAMDFESLNEEESSSQMTLEDAAKVKVTFGRNAGVSLGELAIMGEKGINDIRWIAESYNGTDETLKTAAKMLLAAAVG